MALGLSEEFLLDSSIAYLNHGAYGATPRIVFDEHVKWQRLLELEPVDFLSRHGTERLAHSRQILADFLGTARDNLVYVTNGTVGLNIIANSLKLGPGDELLTTDHEHGGIDRLFRFHAGKSGFKLVHCPIPVPLTTQRDVLDRFLSSVTDDTRAILISHLSSPSSVVFPVKQICQYARSRGIVTIIDGSHVPGQLELDLEDIGADFYVGILHKWVCAPKGCAFVYARPQMQTCLDPLVVSWGWEPKLPGPSRFVEIHEWQGSRDTSAFLSVPAALEFWAARDWPGIRQACRDMAMAARREVCAMFDTEPYHPDSPEWHGQIVCAPLPAGTDAVELLHRLRHEDGIDVSVDYFANNPRVRISVQVYNDWTDIERLLDALKRQIKGPYNRMAAQ